MISLASENWWRHIFLLLVPIHLSQFVSKQYAHDCKFYSYQCRHFSSIKAWKQNSARRADNAGIVCQTGSVQPTTLSNQTWQLDSPHTHFTEQSPRRQAMPNILQFFFDTSMDYTWSASYKNVAYLLLKLKWYDWLVLRFAEKLQDIRNLGTKE